MGKLKLGHGIGKVGKYDFEMCTLYYLKMEMADFK